MCIYLQIFSLKKLEWPEHYTQDKVLPLITLWDMTDIVKGGNHGHLTPHRYIGDVVIVLNDEYRSF
jgi:hypothetical protein